MPGNTVEKAFISSSQAMQPKCVQNLHPPQICAEALIGYGKVKHTPWRHRSPDFIQHLLDVGDMFKHAVAHGISKTPFGQWQGRTIRLHKQRVNLPACGFMQWLPPWINAQDLLTGEVSLGKMPIARTDIQDRSGNIKTGIQAMFNGSQHPAEVRQAGKMLPANLIQLIGRKLPHECSTSLKSA